LLALERIPIVGRTFRVTQRCYEADEGPPQSFCTLLGPSSR